MKYGQNLLACNEQIKIQQKELEDKKNSDANKQLAGAVGIQVGVAGVVWGTFGDSLKSYAF